MRVLIILTFLTVVLCAQSDLGYAPKYKFPFKTFNTQVVDSERGRTLSLDIFAPERAFDVRVFPVIVFSPEVICGEGKYTYLFEAWAKAGFITIVVSHPSDFRIDDNEANVVQYLLALDKTSEYIERPLDLRFVINELFWNRITGLRGIADVGRVGVAGHSLGAHTAFMLAGQQITVQDSIYSVKEKRVKAFLGFSGQGPASFGLTENSWDEVEVPMMQMFGTNDMGVGIHDEFDRRFAYDHVASKNKFLVLISGATKCVFSDVEKRGFRKINRDPRHHSWIAQISSAYWHMIFNEDKVAERWLKSGDIEKTTYKECTVEFPGKTDG